MSALVRCIGIAIVAIFWSFPGQAQSVAVVEPLKWHCVQTMDAQFNVACRPLPADAPIDLIELIESTAVAAAIVTPPNATGLVPVAQRGAAEVYSAPAWLIPLHVAPSDAAHVQLLLESVLCGAQSHCWVSYGTRSNDAASMTLAGR